MSILRLTNAIVVLSALSFTTQAQAAAEHTQHHPVTVAQATAQPAMPQGTMAPRPGASSPMGSMPSMAAMDARMKEMVAMHEKMVNAKTPEERNALMSEHLNTMHSGMAMMHRMQGGTGPQMGGMRRGNAMAGTMEQRQQMMERRMDMMQAMMQMMMDRMPAAPTK